MIEMKMNRRLLAAGAAIVAVAAGGIGVAYAVNGDSEEQATGPEAEAAKSAALDAVGGGGVVGVEHDDGDGSGVYEVEVKRGDGSQVEVHVDAANQAVGTEADDDSGPDEEDDSGEADDD
jgi:hypothetical protein